jgi:hypothetical protein
VCAAEAHVMVRCLLIENLNVHVHCELLLGTE